MPVVATIGRDLDARDRRSTGPCAAMHQDRATREHCSLRKRRDDSARSDRSQWATIDDVTILLIEAVEGRGDQTDAREPFDRCHAVPTGHDEPERCTVLGWERL